MLTDEAKLIFGSIAPLLAIASFLPYLVDVLRRKTRPHVYSWLIWSVLGSIGFFAQLAEGGGAGSWATGTTAALCAVIFVLALRVGERGLRSGDKVCLSAAVAAIPLWLITATPLWSVLLVSAIDALAFVPTFRKAYHRPFEETASTYALNVIKWLCGLLAMQTYAATTVIYPVSLMLTNTVFVSMLAWRRRKAPRSEASTALQNSSREVNTA